MRDTPPFRKKRERMGRPVLIAHLAHEFGWVADEGGVRATNVIPFPLKPRAAGGLFMMTSRPDGVIVMPCRGEKEPQTRFDEFAIWANRFGRRLASFAGGRQVEGAR